MRVMKTVMEMNNNMMAFADTMNIELKKGSIFEQSAEVGLEYVKSIDVDRLLAPSYEMHNIDTPNNAIRYGGWEKAGTNNWNPSVPGNPTNTLAGHSLGHWMSAAAVFYCQSKDESILKKLDYAVGKLKDLQMITGSGYIGGCREETFIKCFRGEKDWASGYWVPWYGIHKIYQGLLDAYEYTDNETALSVLEKFADWAVEGISNLSEEQMQEVLNVEYGGMNEIFARMYGITGDEKYLNAARKFTHDVIIDPLVDGTDNLSGLHANTQIPKIVGVASIYEQQPEKYKDYRTASEIFWHFVNDNRGYAIGGNSISEHFEAKGAESLGIKTCESCNTYNMMRLTEHLFSWDHKSEYMDWYEKALYNHILGQQEPVTGEKMYFVSLLQGHHRVYEMKEKSWWCCTGTGMENPGRYTRTIYFEDNNDLYINLYIPNIYKWVSKGITFEVETDYPYSDKVRLTVIGGSAFANLKFRVPGWIATDMTVSAHGEIIKTHGGGYSTVSGTWNKGDVIEITIPMNVRIYKSRIPDQIVYEYGPVVLAADLGSCENIDGVEEHIFNETRIDSVTTDVPNLITKENEKPESIIKPKDLSKLEFIIDGSNVSDGRDIKLKPFYEIHHRFYNVYWNLNSEGDTYTKWLNDISIDILCPDGQQDEKGHGLEQNDTSGKMHKNSHQGSFYSNGTAYFYRDAYGSADAFFQYCMNVDENIQNYLFVRYWGSDESFKNEDIVCSRDFNIYVDGEFLANQHIENNYPDAPYDVFYKIPLNLTRGKNIVTVRFEAKNETSCAGGMLEMRITNAEK